MDPLTTPNTGVPTPPAPQERTPIGPIAGAVIVIALLVAGGLYFWGSQSASVTDDTPYIPDDGYMMPEGSMPTGQLQSDTAAGLPPQSSSDDVSSIEADMNAMDMGAMEAENEAEINNI